MLYRETYKQIHEDVLAIRALENDIFDIRSIMFAIPIRAYVPPISFSQLLQKSKLEKQLAKFKDFLRALHIYILFINAILQILNYTKLLKEIID